MSEPRAALSRHRQADDTAGMSYSNASQQYLKNAVLTATPEQLQLMLYDGAIRFATRGQEALAAKDRTAAFNALERAQRIMLELANGIRRDANPDLADRMAAVYNFVYRRLVDANLNQDAATVTEALQILRYERETWLMLMERLQQQAGAAKAAVVAAATQRSPEPEPANPSGFVPDTRPSTNHPAAGYAGHKRPTFYPGTSPHSAGFSTEG